MKHVIVPHQEWVLADFTKRILELEEAAHNHYFRGAWVNANRGSSPTQGFIYELVDLIMIRLAARYYVNVSREVVVGYVLGTIALGLGPEEEPPYPIDVDILSNHEQLHKYQGRYNGLFERLLNLYGSPPGPLIYSIVTTSITNLIRLVISDVFVQMENGVCGAGTSPQHRWICPAAQLYEVQRVQDASVDARLVIGADLVWIPVVPPNQTMRQVMDTIFGFDVEPKKETDWKVTYRSMEVNDLNDAQISKALALNKGVIDSVYEENGLVHAVMFDDLNHPYVWREFKIDRLIGGNWYPAREHMSYLKLMKSERK